MRNEKIKRMLCNIQKDFSMALHFKKRAYFSQYTLSHRKNSVPLCLQHIGELLCLNNIINNFKTLQANSNHEVFASNSSKSIHFEGQLSTQNKMYADLSLVVQLQEKDRWRKTTQ